MVCAGSGQTVCDGEPLVERRLAKIDVCVNVNFCESAFRWISQRLRPGIRARHGGKLGELPGAFRIHHPMALDARLQHLWPRPTTFWTAAVSLASRHDSLHSLTRSGMTDSEDASANLQGSRLSEPRVSGIHGRTTAKASRGPNAPRAMNGRRLGPCAAPPKMAMSPPQTKNGPVRSPPPGRRSDHQG